MHAHTHTHTTNTNTDTRPQAHTHTLTKHEQRGNIADTQQKTNVANTSGGNKFKDNIAHNACGWRDSGEYGVCGYVISGMPVSNSNA